MAKVKIKVSFRYECEDIIEDVPESWREEISRKEAEIREDIKKELDFDLASENNPGFMSDWSLEVEGVEE